MIVKAKDLQDTDTVGLARSLLGKQLVLKAEDGSLVRRRVTETEAYHGPEDRASHASRGRTPRNSPMFASGGIWYVYLCYGVHEMLNLVTGPAGYPAAVLLRGVEGARGPGKLTKLLGIDRRFNALPATKVSGLWLEDDGLRPPEGEIAATPRIGVAYAGPEWAAKPWRFVWKLEAETRRRG